MGESGVGIPGGQDRSISLARANVCTLAVSVPLLGLMLATYLVLSPADGVSVAGLSLRGVLLFLVLIVAGILVHEAIHGLAWVAFGHLPRGRTRFGIQASTLTPYAHALDPMSARAYRIGAVPPALLLGVLPFALGTAIGSTPLALYGMIFVFAAGGDLAHPVADPQRRCRHACARSPQPGGVHRPAAARRLTARSSAPPAQRPPPRVKGKSKVDHRPCQAEASIGRARWPPPQWGRPRAGWPGQSCSAVWS